MRHLALPAFRIPSVLVACAAAVLSACSSGGGSGGASAEGIDLPSEVSAVSAKSAGEGARPGAAARSSPRLAFDALSRSRSNAGVDDLADDSDYHTAAVRKFVEIKVLDVFGIIETIFTAVGQTHYASADNVNQGPYTCLVAWEDEGEGGATQTQMQTWTIDSSIVVEGATTINRVQVWIVETSEDGGERLIRVQMDIEQAPTHNEDETLADLGIWSLRALFGEEAEPVDYFFADAAVMEDGSSRLRIREQFVNEIDGEEFVDGTQAIVFRNEGSGHGKVRYPDWSACFDPDADPGICDGGPPPVEVAFSYNENYLTVQVEGEAAVSFARDDEHPIVHRYGIFDADDGSDVKREREFGFPVRTDDGRSGWYGAWQDRHQLWVNGDTIEDGTEVTRQDVPPGQEAPTYTTRSFQGSLTRIDLVPGSLDQVVGIPAEIFLFDNFQIRWNDAGGVWEQCLGNDGMGGCASLEDFTAGLPTLAYAGEGDQRNLFISRCGMGGCTNYIYSVDDGGFLEAQPGENGRWESTGTPYTPADGDELWCSVGGRTYILYSGDFDGPETTSGWVEKTLISFDHSTWTPSFDPDGDRQFNFEVGREYFISNRGSNFRVTRLTEDGDADDYRLFMEAQTVAKPSGDLASVYEEGTVLVEPWDPAANSTYLLDVTPGSPTYLALKYHTVSDQDAQNGIEVGNVVNQDRWGLRIEGDDSPLEDATLYNWEYRSEGEFGGGVTYLIDEDDEYVLLSDPLRFEPVQLPRTTDLVNDVPEDSWLSFSLMFDGHLHGLSDTWFELEKVNFSGDEIPSILANNVVVPDGTELVDGDGQSWFVRALDTGIFLGYVTAFPAGPAPDMTLPDDVDLEADIPAFVPHDVPADIPAAELRYIRGIPIE